MNFRYNLSVSEKYTNRQVYHNIDKVTTDLDSNIIKALISKIKEIINKI